MFSVFNRNSQAPQPPTGDLLSNLVFEVFGSSRDLACFSGFNSVFEFDAGDELRPVFRTVCLLTLRGHFPSHIFESLFWRFVADA